MSYDSKVDTEEHIFKVAANLGAIMSNLSQRSAAHDASKLKPPEKEAFDALTPKLKDLQYGSEEYRASLREMKPALAHHYEHNSHHPEHFEHGILDMSLMDILEMLADWKAAGERHDPPNTMTSSIKKNAERFNIPPYLTNILFNTARELDWN
jgi:uncharacterized protein DUF5662